MKKTEKNKEQIDMLSYGEWQYKFASRLKKFMRAKQITQTELSKRTGLSRTAISSYLNGYSIPNAYNVYLIAKALDCKPFVFFDF